MKQIKLSQGKFALVDDDMLEELNQFNWYANKLGNTFYALRSVTKEGKQKKISMHRQILGLTDSKIFTDHINHNGLDNQVLNLRACTRSENCRNSKSHIGGSSKYKGVCFHKPLNKWLAQIMIKGKKTNLGYFINEVEAAKAYDLKAKELFGEFANLNFIIKRKRMKKMHLIDYLKILKINKYEKTIS